MYLVRRHAYRLLRKAVKELSCSHCDHKFNKGYNYKRHLAVIHRVNEFGQPTSVAERECYQELARKEARKRKLASCTTTSDEPKVDEPQQEPASRACTDEPSPYPTPAYGPDKPVPPELAKAARQKALRKFKLNVPGQLHSQKSRK